MINRVLMQGGIGRSVIRATRPGNDVFFSDLDGIAFDSNGAQIYLVSEGSAVHNAGVAFSGIFSFVVNFPRPLPQYPMVVASMRVTSNGTTPDTTTFQQQLYARKLNNGSSVSGFWAKAGLYNCEFKGFVNGANGQPTLIRINWIIYLPRNGS